MVSVKTHCLYGSILACGDYKMTAFLLRSNGAKRDMSRCILMQLKLLDSLMPLSLEAAKGDPYKY